MPNGRPGGAEQLGSGEEGSEPSSDSNPHPDSSFGPRPLRVKEKGGEPGPGSQESVLPPVRSIVISQPEEAPNTKGGVSKSAPAIERDERVGTVAALKKGCLPRSESDREQCRICQHQTEEPLLNLGCRCRGELAIAHRSCIDIWFRTKGSNKCEICQQVAANVPSPVSQLSTSYWIWRVNSAYGGANSGRGIRERRCFNPLWVAFTVLIGGLFLDILISVSLGVSALPVNIIIGVLILLGLGTVFRLAMECFQEWRSRRNMQRPELTVNPTDMNPGYDPPV